MAEQVEPVVWEAIERALNNPDVIASEVQRRHKQAAEGQQGFERERAHYKRQLARCEQEAAKTWDLYIDGHLSMERFKVIDAEVQTKRQRLEEELKRLDEAEAAIVVQAEQITALYQYCEKVRAKLHRFTVEEKQLACDALNISVTWRPGEELEITGSIPLGIEHSVLG
jgi:hypothetical protein